MTGDNGLKVVAFSLAATRFVLPAGQVAALRPPDGNDEGAIAMEDLLGLPRDAGGLRQVLVLRAGTATRAVAVPGAVRIDDLPASTFHPLPVLVQRHCAVRGLAALALDPGGVSLVIDPARLDLAGAACGS